MCNPITVKIEEARALHEGRLHQLRRKVECELVGERIIPLPDGWGFDVVTQREGQPTRIHETLRCPLGRPGDHLWVREPHALYGDDPQQVEYRASPLCGGDPDNGWRSPVQMPRWASRFTLTITAIRLERLQSTDHESALACGVQFTDFGTYLPPGAASLDGGHAYHPLKQRQHPGYHMGDVALPDQCHETASGALAGWWERGHGEGAWEANPWVWVMDVATLDSE